MTAIIALLAVIGLVAGCLARWTRFHPLAIAAVGGLPGGLIGLLLPGEVPNGEALAFAAIVYVVTTAAAALGAFAGWLRRNNLARNI